MSICLLQGGRHVDYVVDQIVAKLIEVVKKKNKAGVTVKPFQVAQLIICTTFLIKVNAVFSL